MHNLIQLQKHEPLKVKQEKKTKTAKVYSFETVYAYGEVKGAEIDK